MSKYVKNMKDWQLSMCISLIMLVNANIIHYERLSDYSYDVLFVANTIWTLVAWGLSYGMIKSWKMVIKEIKKD